MTKKTAFQFAIFFPRFIHYNFLFFAHHGGLRFWGGILRLGFWVHGFQLIGFEACG